jgi:hypothetical protein
VNVVLGAVLGCTVGYLVALVVRPPPRYFNFTVVMIGIGKCMSSLVTFLVILFYKTTSFWGVLI